MWFLTILVATGITYLITSSKLLGPSFIPVRPLFSKNKVLEGLTGCTFCTGFWVMLMTRLAIASPEHFVGLFQVGLSIGGIAGAISTLYTKLNVVRNFLAYTVAASILVSLLGSVCIWIYLGNTEMIMTVILDSFAGAFVIMVLHDFRDALLKISSLALPAHGNTTATTSSSQQHILPKNTTEVVEDPARNWWSSSR